MSTYVDVTEAQIPSGVKDSDSAHKTTPGEVLSPAYRARPTRSVVIVVFLFSTMGHFHAKRWQNSVSAYKTTPGTLCSQAVRFHLLSLCVRDLMRNDQNRDTSAGDCPHSET